MEILIVIDIIIVRIFYGTRNYINLKLQKQIKFSAVISFSLNDYRINKFA